MSTEYAMIIPVVRVGFAVAIIAQAGAVLNGQDVPPCHPLQQIRPPRRHHLRRRHSPVVQQSSKPHLASPDAAQPAQADTVRTKRAQPLQQKGPAVAKRSSPKYPRLVSMAASPPSTRLSRCRTKNHLNGQDGLSFQTWVHPVGTSRAVTTGQGPGCLSTPASR